MVGEVRANHNCLTADLPDSAFRLLADNIPTLCWIADAEGYIVWYNPRWYEYTGTTPAQMENWGWQSVHDPATLPDILERWSAAIVAGKPFEMVFPLRGADGRFRPFLTRINPAFDDQGRVLRWFGVNMDISRQVEAESAAMASQRRFRDIADSMPQMVWSSGPDGRGDYFNARWYEYTGLPAGATDADGWIARVHPDDRGCAAIGWHRCLDTGDALHLECRLQHRSGAYRWVLARAHAQRDAEGRITRWYGTHTEIEDIVQARKLLQRSRDELEREVLARQAKLSQAQAALLQSQKLEAMGQLTGGVAHDFNNLLTPIIASLDLLKRRCIGGDREQRLIHGAYQSAERAKVLVQRLLAFARRQPLQPAAVDVRALIEGLADLIASTIGPQIVLSLEVEDALPLAKADANQLELALLNLAVNARDAIEGAGRIRISAACETIQTGAMGAALELQPGRYVRLTVGDTGHGMDSATIARAVEPFFSTKGVGQGTGLGLSMAHGLASQLGGTLRIESAPGRGTRVSIWLPESFEQAPAGDAGDAARTGRLAAGAALLVDDEEYIRLTTADMLTELGFEVHEAASAEAALDALDSGLRPDLLITDHLMPGMTGVELARIVRARQPQTKILIVSGFADVDGIDASLARLTKPFVQRELAAAMADLGAAGTP
jgi:PAS domain S-box-containing protein